MRIKYVVHPDWVISKNDGQRHFIGFLQLCKLYNVNPVECANAGAAGRIMWPKDAIHLYPRYDGNYTLQEKQP